MNVRPAQCGKADVTRVSPVFTLINPDQCCSERGDRSFGMIYGVQAALRGTDCSSGANDLPTGFKDLANRRTEKIEFVFNGKYFAASWHESLCSPTAR